MNDEQLDEAITTAPLYIDSKTRYKQERELRKAKKKARKEITPQVGPKAAKKLVKEATKRVMTNRQNIPTKPVVKAAARGA
jgi:ribosomal protein L18